MAAINDNVVGPSAIENAIEDVRPGDMQTFQPRDGVLVLVLGTDPHGTPSASGKSRVFFSTRGNVKDRDSGFTMGINIYKSI